MTFAAFRILIAVVVCLACVSAPVWGQSPEAEVPAIAEASARPSIQPSKVDEKPRVDGFLDEPFWQGAQVVGEFHQQRPFTGDPASQSTEVRIVYTQKALYIGFICHDDDPSSIVRRILGRDADVSADDSFTVVLAPSHWLE